MHQYSNTNKTLSGFTLIELSIVLVIIGLVVGGVLVGQDLVKGAERRAVIKQMSEYETAIITFKVKYNSLAGDTNNASTWFTGASNGDGNGIIDQPLEYLYLWQHLGYAGLIRGNYTGALIGGDVVAGQNAPKSIISSGYVAVPDDLDTGAQISGGTDITTGVNNILQFYIGTTAPNADIGSRIVCGGGIVSNQFAYLIDKKVDDGIADKGKWRSLLIDISSGGTITDSCSTYTPTDNATMCTFGYWFRTP